MRESSGQSDLAYELEFVNGLLVSKMPANHERGEVLKGNGEYDPIFTSSASGFFVSDLIHNLCL